jgi:hypothetical protein
MDKTIKMEISATEAAEIQTQIHEYIAEMQQANERIKKDQEEIDLLKTRTRATLAELAKLQVI